jgi:Fe-S-cluster-containing dehydrogenase component
MSPTRRDVLKGIASVAAASAAGIPEAYARERKTPPADAAGLLYDATRCIGCKACMVRCKEANGLPPDTDTPRGAMYDAPDDLNGSTKNIIKLYRGDDGRTSYMKAQCMHCVDPACASVCMISAFYKGPRGIVAYDPDKCVGCRYCQMACPFNVPKYQWHTAFPKIVKCEMCRHLLEKGEIPACAAACPREAVTFGSRAEILDEAKKRIVREPGRYYPKVYGESDGGGTQVLYLSAAGIPFEKLGLPDLGDEPVPELTESLQHAVYQGFIAPAILYGILGIAVYRSWRRERREEGGEE